MQSKTKKKKNMHKDKQKVHKHANKQTNKKK